ncbi:MAG: hypothetical protein U0992_08460 [Planctomycetaceae bacterium]
MLLDDVLIAETPQRLDAYCAALATVNPRDVEALANRCARRTTERLAHFVGLFLSERFLYDYLELRRGCCIA